MTLLKGGSMKKKIIWLILTCFIVVALLLASCTLGVIKYENVSEVVRALDKHSLSNGDKPYYQLIGAYDGMKYDVSPGGYRLEIYVYQDLSRLVAMETIDNQVHIEGNAILLLHTTNKEYLDRLVADLRD